MFAPTRTPHIVLIETLSETDVDRDVIPSAVEFVLNNSIPNKLKGEGPSPGVCLLTIDRPVRHYERLRKRRGILSTHILDGYTDLFGERMPTKSPGRGAGVQKSWHFERTAPPDRIAHSIIEAVKGAFLESEGTGDHGKIIVIDSLSSILELSSSLEVLLRLLDSIAADDIGEDSSSPSTTLIITIRRNQLNLSLRDGLVKLASTHVRLSQTSQNQNTTALSRAAIDRDYVRINVRKRKSSGRIHFEEHMTKMDWTKTKLLATEDLENFGPPLTDEELNKIKEKESLELAQLGLSFRVTLSTKEREVRAAAGLPYLHRDEELANSALAFHPENLRLQKEGIREIEADSSASSGTASEEEELFSEDV